MTQGIQKAIQALQSQQKHHQDCAARLARAIEELRGLVDAEAPAAKAIAIAKPVKRKQSKAKKAAAAKEAPAKKVAAAKKADGKPTLAKALAYVLGEHRNAGSAGVGAQQLMQEVGQAGFKFGGSNKANNMNYVYKTLRTNAQFKRVGDGHYVLA
jgi:membrane protein involved in colicin uptake